MHSLVEIRPQLASLALIGGIFVAFAVYLGWGETLDDAAISFAYAKHLVEGDGLGLVITLAVVVSKLLELREWWLCQLGH